jgi:phage regulator Rha-like protein
MTAKSKLMKLTHTAGGYRVDSRLIADRLGVQPRAVMALLSKYQADFEELDHLTFQMSDGGRRQGGGKRQVYALLSETQAYFLLTLSRNLTDEIVNLKKSLAYQFARLRKAAEYRARVDWQRSREAGKLSRQQETDAVHEFIQYAEAQGSKNAGRYYLNLTRVTYNTLFSLNHATNWRGTRDLLDQEQLGQLQTAETVVRLALSEGMRRGLGYKDVFRLAEARLQALSSLLPERKPPALALNAEADSDTLPRID